MVEGVETQEDAGKSDRPIWKTQYEKHLAALILTAHQLGLKHVEIDIGSAYQWAAQQRM